MGGRGEGETIYQLPANSPHSIPRRPKNFIRKNEDEKKGERGERRRFRGKGGAEAIFEILTARHSTLRE